jgi:hypothetical protein
MSNAEQGIAQAQTEAAKGRLAKTEGLQKQQKWNIAYLSSGPLHHRPGYCMDRWSGLSCWPCSGA